MKRVSLPRLAGISVGLSMAWSLLVPMAAHAVQLRWSYLGNETPVFREILQKYQKKTGNVVNITFCENTNDLTNTLMDTPPDLISMNPSQMTEYIEMGIFADISKEIAADKKLLTDLIPSLLKSFSNGKKIYALPWNSQVTALRYNADLFKKSGVQVPSANWRYTGEYYAAMKKLSKDTNGDGKNDQHGLVGVPIGDWMPMVYSSGLKLISDDGKKFMFQGPEAVKVLDFIKKLHKENLARTWDWNQGDDQPFPFMDGKVGTIISSWRMMGPDIKFKLGMCVPPRGTKGNFTSVEAAGIGVFNTSKKKRAAADFARFLVSPEIQALLFKKDGVMPTSLAALESREVKNAKTDIDPSLIRALPKAKAMSANPAFRRSFGLNRGLSEYIDGEVSATDFITSIKERVEEAISNSNW